MRKAALIVSLILLIIGMAILVFDTYTSHRFGFHVNEVAGVTDDGQPIDWPTGERPTFTLIPIPVYAFAFCLAAGAVFSLRFYVPRIYSGRMSRGTE